MSDIEIKKTAAQRTAEALERRTKSAEAELAAREEQFADDIEAIEVLEHELGARIHYSKQVRNFTPGLPVVVGVRAPEPAEYKRMFSGVNKNGASGDAKVQALLQLAGVCWVYPAEKEKREAMVEANAGLLASVGNFANTLAEVELREEGKG